MADYRTFADLTSQVARGIKDYKEAQSTMIGEMLNMVYYEMIEVDPLYPLFWLIMYDDSLAGKDNSSISGITKADPGVVTTSAAHGLVDGDLVSHHNIVGMTELNDRLVRVGTVPTTTTYKLEDVEGGGDLATTNFTTYSSGGTVHHRGVTIASPSIEKIVCAAFHEYDPMDIVVNPKELESNSVNWWGDNTGVPEKCFHRKRYAVAGTEENQIIWFPGCDNDYAPFRYWYEKRVSPMSGTNAPELPPRFHNMIATGALARLVEMGGVQVENAVIWPKLYQAELEQLKSYNQQWWEEHQEAFKTAPFGL